MTVRSMLAVVLSPSKMRYDANRSLTKTRRTKAALTGCFSVFLSVLLFFGVQLFAVVWTSRTKVYALEQTFIIESSSKTEPVKEENRFVVKTAEIQAVVDAWSKKYPSKASVVITEPQSGAVVATSLPDKQYFTASIYKLYVAYLGLQDYDAGITANTVFLNGQTRLECIHKMIQSSDSPCAEKMLSELGKKNVDVRLKALGLTGTSLSSFMTTASDANKMTQIIANKQGLKEESAQLLVDAMDDQMYRSALPQGFKNSKVSDKVGFYETGYHDTANVTPKNGQVYTVTVLSENMGSRQIAELAKLLEPLL